MRLSVPQFRAGLVLCSLLASAAFAQGTSVITGTVTDAATGKPVPDVVVTARAPSLQGEQIAVTDATGLYRIAQLPSGTFELSLEKETFKPFKRADIVVRVDRTVRVNIQLQPESVQGETVVVVGKAPTVDVGSTTTGINVGKEFINNIAFIQPSGSGVRSFESLASVAPQVVADDLGYGFSGAQSPENLYLIDGVSVSDPAYGINGAQMPVEFVEEANIITGGYQAEYGRATGGVINVVTKSGSNEFHGSVWSNWTPGALAGSSPFIPNDTSVFVTRGKLWNTVDLGAEIGGPIIKDKLWFYVGFSPSFNRDFTEMHMRRFELNPGKTDFVYCTQADTTTKDPVTGKPFCTQADVDQHQIKSSGIAGTYQHRFDDVRAFSYIAKLTYLLNSDNTVSVSVIGSPTTSRTPYSFTDRHVPAVDASSKPWNGGVAGYNNSTSVSVKYSGAFLDKHLLVDATLGFFRTEQNTQPTDGSKLNWTKGVGATGYPQINYQRTNTDANVAALANPHTIEDFMTLQDPSLCEAKGFRTNTLAMVRGQLRFVMACPVGGYTIGGMGFMDATTIDRYAAKGAVTYLLRAAGHHIFKAGLDLEQTRYDTLKGYSGGDALNESLTGTRFDDSRQFGFLTAPDTATTQHLVHSTPYGVGIGTYLQDSWSVLDLATLNMGVRYENQQLHAADGTLGMTLNNMVSPRVGVIYDFTQQGRSKFFANYAQYFEAVPLDIADRSLTGENQYAYRRYATPGKNPNDPTNPGCNPLADINQSLNECQSPKNWQHINRLLGQDYNVNGSAVLTGQGKTPIDPSTSPQSTSEVVLGGEYEVVTDGRVSATYTKRWLNKIVEDMSNDEGSTYFIGNPGYGLGNTFPAAKRDYDAVTLAFTKAFSEGWMAQLSYTWSYLRGNYNGLYRPETGQLDPNISSDFDLKSLMLNRTGILDGNRYHFVKAYASKEFIITGSVGLVLGLSYEGRSGGPINYLASHPIYGPDEAFVLPRGSGGELPWRHAINAKVGVSYRFSRDTALQISADVFNMFNFQSVTAVDQTYSNESILPVVTPSGKSPQEALCIAGNVPLSQCAPGGYIPGVNKVDADTGAIVPASVNDVNSNFKRPTGYQAPISVRFGVKLTF